MKTKDLFLSVNNKFIISAIYFIAFLFANLNQLFAQENLINNYYLQAFDDLKVAKTTKEAVFIVENAYFENTLDTSYIFNQLSFLSKLCRSYCVNSKLFYGELDSTNIALSGAIFKVLTDTTIILNADDTLFHIPFTYDFEDMWGEQEWSNMFVTKLLATHKGNCHSLPFLYKILADELGVEAHLALAPNHIYIKTKSEKYGWYNTELTSGMFPIDAWIMASGYIHLNAIQNRLYMNALDDKQSIAICMTDLAEGYARKTGFTDPVFVIMCCDTALKHFPNYVNATLLKIKTLKHQFETELAKPEPDKEVSDKLFAEIERLSVELYKLGYRQMPKEMYLDWLVSLKTEKEKYTNKQIMNEEKK